MGQAATGEADARSTAIHTPQEASLLGDRGRHVLCSAPRIKKEAP